MKSCPSDPREIWRDIPGYNGAYQVSTEGSVCKILPGGERMAVKSYVRANRTGKGSSNAVLWVNLTYPDGRRVERAVLRLVAETFLGITEDQFAVHRNGRRSDVSVRNIKVMSCTEMGRTYGGTYTRRPVVKIDDQGEIVACYASAGAAARENYVSRKTVLDRCNRRIRKEFALDGYSYRWDD